MQFRLRSLRPWGMVLLPCWLFGGPVATTLQSVAVCPHHDAMPSSMHHGAGTQAPCWCPHMSGGAAIELPTLPAIALEPAALISGVAAVTAIMQPRSMALPSSPSFAPTPPPPNSQL